jgi:hypothetical protein
MTSLKQRLDAVTAHEAFKENATNVVLELLDRVGTFGQKADEYRGKAKERRATSLPADAELLEPPQDVLTALDEVMTAIRSLSFDLSDLSAYIWTLVPEIKEEDNAGVSIQQHLLEAMSEAQKTLNGGGKEAAPRFVHLGAKQEYLGKRADLEMKLSPGAKDTEPPKSKSLRAQLHDLDNNVLGAIAATYLDLRRIALAVSTTFVRNQDRILKPRRHGHGMIG